jgi:hypothetical protein
MILNPWEIVFVRTDERDETGHPAIVLACLDVLRDGKQPRVNVVTCTKRPPAYDNRPHQVLLNGADGLEFPSLVDCSMVYVVMKSKVMRTVGSVSFERRKEIARKVRGALVLG